MARAPETGFYFEPIAERLALVVEGSPFPSDDHWAWLGDPIEMSPQQAALVVAVRWPGVDPDDLTVEFDTNFERAVQAAEEDRVSRAKGEVRVPTEFDIDIDLLLAQAQALRDQVREVAAETAAPGANAEQARIALEAAEQSDRLRELIEQARRLTQPLVPGRAMKVGEAKPQSQHLLHAVQEEHPELRAPAMAAPPPEESGPILQPEVMPAALEERPARQAAAAPPETDAEWEAPQPRAPKRPAPEGDESAKGARKRPPRIARGALRALEEQKPAEAQAPAPAAPGERPKIRPRIERPRASSDEENVASPPAPAAPREERPREERSREEAPARAAPRPANAARAVETTPPVEPPRRRAIEPPSEPEPKPGPKRPNIRKR